MKTMILNAFSLNMIAAFPATINVEEISVAEASEMAADAESAVGHTDTAAVFSTVLGVEVPANRATVSLGAGDVVVVGQYRGPRMPEGETTLPEGATIKWLLVSASDRDELSALVERAQFRHTILDIVAFLGDDIGELSELAQEKIRAMRGEKIS